MEGGGTKLNGIEVGNVFTNPRFPDYPLDYLPSQLTIHSIIPRVGFIKATIDPRNPDSETFSYPSSSLPEKLHLWVSVYHSSPSPLSQLAHSLQCPVHPLEFPPSTTSWRQTPMATPFPLTSSRVRSSTVSTWPLNEVQPLVSTRSSLHSRR